MSDFLIIIFISFALFIQLEAFRFKAKINEELGMCQENMAVIWQDSTELLTKYKALQKRSKR